MSRQQSGDQCLDAEKVHWNNRECYKRNGISLKTDSICAVWFTEQSKICQWHTVFRQESHMGCSDKSFWFIVTSRAVEMKGSKPLGFRGRPRGCWGGNVVWSNFHPIGMTNVPMFLHWNLCYRLTNNNCTSAHFKEVHTVAVFKKTLVSVFVFFLQVQVDIPCQMALCGKWQEWVNHI